MLRTKNEQIVDFKCIRNGNGEAEMRLILNGEEELYGKGRLFNHMFLAPGRSVGDHTHVGDNEIYYFLSGTGTYNDNGVYVKVHPGDTTICNNGELHGLVLFGGLAEDGGRDGRILDEGRAEPALPRLVAPAPLQAVRAVVDDEGQLPHVKGRDRTGR